MKKELSRSAFIAMVVASSLCAEEAAEIQTQEIMELGGSVTLDAGTDLSTPEDVSFQVGTVDLSAIVNIAPRLKAFIQLKSGGDLSKVVIDQALVEWSSESGIITAIGGQHSLNNGLLSTHLISDPLITSAVALANPGVTANFSTGKITPGIGFCVAHTDEMTEDQYSVTATDAVVSTSVVTQEESYDLIGVINLDARFNDDMASRLSLRIQEDIVDFTLGGGFAFGPASLDVELHSQILDDDEALASGYYTGLAVGVNEHLEFALRYDGLSEDSFENLQHRIGLGTTVSLQHGLFVALEYSHDRPSSGDGVNQIALQFGLESTLKLPGFQRRTLTNG